MSLGDVLAACGCRLSRRWTKPASAAGSTRAIRGFTRDGLTSLAAARHYLPPSPDSVEGIAQIKRAFIVGPLSNDTTARLSRSKIRFGGDLQVSGRQATYVYSLISPPRTGFRRICCAAMSVTVARG